MARTSKHAKKSVKRTHDLAVKVGTYEDENGDEKGRYENVGVMLEGENGPFLLLKKTFNPAGVESDGDRIIISLFEVEDDKS